jgi:hypothetical protein
MRNILALIFGTLIFSCSEKPEDVLNIDVSNDIVKPKHYVVTKTSEDLIIDGKASEGSWNNAAFTDKFIDIEGVKVPKYDTQVKMLWDDEFLYVYAKMEEPHVWGNIKQRDAIIFHNNDFEVFIDPSKTGFRYGEIELNALNTVWDLYLNAPYRVGAYPIFEWNLEKLQTAVHVEGTLNNPTNTDSYWSVEMAIPLKPYMRMISGSKGKINDGEQWRINFSRVQWDHDIVDGNYTRKRENGKRLPEYNWVWSNQKVIDMHQPEKWGYLQFSDNTSLKNVEFKEDEDLLIKQTAFAIFRNTHRGKLIKLRKDTTSSHKRLKVTYDSDKYLNVKFHKTSFGFEYVLTSPITNHTYSINNEGKLKKL